MTMVLIDKEKIVVEDHAGDKIVCAMLTSLTVSLISNITQRLNIDAKYELSDGHFVLYFKNLTQKATDLVDAYIYSLRGLSESYPENIRFI